jgi:superfamily II DNA/RNA helicase
VNAPTGSGKTLAYLASIVNDLQVRVWTYGCEIGSVHPIVHVE